MARTVILSDSGKWVTLLRFEWEWGRCMQGKPLTQKERFYIEKRRGDGVNQATIARELELPLSTISRELRRNTDAAFNGVYVVVN